MIQEQIENDKSLESIVKFFGHNVAYDFRFQIKEINGAAAQASYKFPIHLGLVTIGADVQDTKERQSERNAKLTINFKELDEITEAECLSGPADMASLQTRHYPIRGKIGLYEVFDQYLMLADQKKGKLAKTSPYTDQIIFTTTIGGSITPSVTLKPVALKEISASLDVGGLREDLHSVTVNLTPPSEAAEAGVTRVQIVSDPGLFLSGN